MIKKIIHTADWHLDPYKYHNRFEKTIEYFLTSIKKQLETYSPEEVLVVIVGDLFDNKTKKPSNVAFKVMSKALKDISDTYPTLAVIGNHDYDRRNKSRMDCITPIYHNFKLLGYKNFEFLKYTKCLVKDNIVFCNYSVFEENKRPEEIEQFKLLYPNKTFIGLYHDVIKGATDFHNYDLSQNHPDVNDVSIFNGCDFVMMGDIHKHQEIKNNIPTVYCGSLYQLSYGETVNNHGYCVWDVETKTYEFVELDTDWGKYKLSINDISDIDGDKEVFENAIKTSKLKQNTQVEISLKDYVYPLTEPMKETIKAKISKKYGVSLNNIKPKKGFSKTFTNKLKNLNNISTSVLDSVLDSKKLNESYVEYLKTNFPKTNTTDFFRIDEEVKLGIPRIEDFDTRNRKYKILYIKGENIFSYKEFFRSYGDSEGINLIYSFPENRGGKSALTRMNPFLLFGKNIKYSGKPITYKKVFNNKVKQGKAFIEGEVQIGDDLFFIRRNLNKTSSGNVSHELLVFKYDENGEKVHNLKKNQTIELRKKGINFSIKDAPTTQKKLEKLYGTYEDYLFACYYEHNNIEKWIDKGKADRYRLFCEYLGLGLLEAKYQVANDMLKEHRKIRLNFEHNITEFEDINKSIKLSSLNLSKEKNSYSKELSKLETSIIKLDEKIKKLYHSKHPIDVKLESFDLAEANEEVELLVERINKAEEFIKSLEEEINSFDKNYSNSDYVSEIQNKLEEYEKQFKVIEIPEDLLKKQQELTDAIDSVSISTEMASEGEKYVLRVNELKIEYSTLKNEIKSESKHLKTMPDTITCKKCGNVEHTEEEKEKIQQSIEEQQQRLVKISEEIDNAEEKSREIQKRNKDLIKQLRLNATENLKRHMEKIEKYRNDERQKIQESIDKLNNKLKKVNELSNKKQTLVNANDKKLNIEEKIKSKTKKIEEYNKNNKKIQKNKNISVKISELESEKEEKTQEQFKLRTKIVEIEKEIVQNEFKYESNTKKISKLREENLREKQLLNYLQVHGDNGLSKHIILSVLPQINNDLAIMLSDIDLELIIRFDNKKIEFIVISGEGEQELYECSGLEKTLCCLALHLVFCRMTTLPLSNVLTLDEVIGRVGESNFPIIMKIIKKLCDVFDNVDIVTHTHANALMPLVDNEIEIVKDEGISRIV